MKKSIIFTMIMLSGCTLVDLRESTDDDIQVGKVWERSVHFYDDDYYDEDDEECREILREMKLSKIEE